MSGQCRVTLRRHRAVRGKRLCGRWPPSLITGFGPATGGSPFCDSPEGCKCLFCRHPGSATPNDKEEARWTLITEDGDVVWIKYKNYRAPACTHQSSTISTSTTTSTSTEGTTGGGTGAQSLRGYGRVSCGRSSEIAQSPRHRCQSPRTRGVRRTRKKRRRRHPVVAMRSNTGHQARRPCGGRDRRLASASVSRWRSAF